MDTKTRINELLQIISNNKKYEESVFKAKCIYFVIKNGKLLEIRDNDGSGPKWSVPLKIVKGPTDEENSFVESMIRDFDYDFNAYFFSELLWSYDYDVTDIKDEDIIDFFEDREDEESLEIYKKMKTKIIDAESPFKELSSFVIAVDRCGLDSSRLYYAFEDEYIDLYDNICETGEPMGEFDNLTDEEWINILENIDDHIVKA